MTHGNYYRATMATASSESQAWYCGKGWYGGDGALGMQSSYCYRNAPVCGQTGDPAYSDREAKIAAGQTNWAVYPAFYSSPLVTVEMGCPLFKTSKLLKNRSLVADTYSRSQDDFTVESTGDAIKPGLGQYHHKSGYNVLYGDGHVAWYGDPEHRIMWMDYGPWSDGNAWDHTGSSYDWDRVATLAGLQVWNTTAGASLRGVKTAKVSGRHVVWHLFDGLADIDRGNTPLPQ